MIVGAALVEIHVHGSQSLKAKRGVVRSIKQRVRNRFEIAVAEVGGQDLWQRAQLGLTAVGSDATRVRSVLEAAIRFIEGLHLAEVIGSEVEILDMPQEGIDPDGPWQWESDSDEE
ncbi:MAG: DUF503 domain-containing protein [Myxococcota bacterium]